MTPLARDVFDGATAERRLAAYLRRSPPPTAFGAFSRLELTAAAACITYVERTQLGKRPPLSPPVREAAGATLAIDQATRGNLELVRTLSGERRGSLLAAIDRTVTAAGSRLLAQRLAAPLTDPSAIARRLDAVARIRRPTPARAPTCASGSRPRPIWRARWRASWSAAAGRAISPPSATASLPRPTSRRGWRRSPRARRRASRRRCRRCAGPIAALAAELAAALADELPPFKRDGGFVRAGYDAALDEARALRDESRRVDRRAAGALCRRRPASAR